MIEIPTDFKDFLHWFKEKTEHYWSVAPKTCAKDVECDEWIYGATWHGLEHEQIDSLEAKYNIKFTTEHRAFLNVLHAFDRYEKVEIEDDDTEQSVIEYRPYFYNWLTDQVFIEKYLRWPYETILFDVVRGKNNVWLKSWGPKPGSAEEKEIIFTNWYQHAPPLLPLTAHTFLVSDQKFEKRPVLSVWGSDVIIMGWSLKAYLINKFAGALGLTELVYSEEDKVYYDEPKKDVLALVDEYFQFKLIHPIPYWEEMILYFNSGFHKVDTKEG